MRVYLDQKDWIGLLRAELGRRDDERFEPALVMLREAVNIGAVSLPLSCIHYIETGQRRPYAKREPLAKLMAELSHFHTVASMPVLARAEIRAAIADRFGSRIVSSPPEPFGQGVDHAFGTTFLADSIAAIERRHSVKLAGARELLEWGAIAGHPDNDRRPDQPVDVMRAQVEEAASEYERLWELRRSSGCASGSRSRDVANAQAVIDWLDEIKESLREADANPRVDKDGLTEFIQSVPTVSCYYELRRLKEEATSDPWEGNDLRDLEALAVALVYADVVVTEDEWAHLAKSAFQKGGTRL